MVNQLAEMPIIKIKMTFHVANLFFLIGDNRFIIIDNFQFSEYRYHGYHLGSPASAEND